MIQRGVKFIYLLLGLNCVFAQDITVSDTENINNESLPCDHYAIKRLGMCCSLPNLIPRDAMETCFVSECTRFGSGMFGGGMPFNFMGWRSLFPEPGLLFPSFLKPGSGGGRPRNPDSEIAPGIPQNPDSGIFPGIPQNPDLGMIPGVGGEAPQNPEGEVPENGALGRRSGFPAGFPSFPGAFPGRKGKFPAPEGDADAEWVGTKAQRGRNNKRGYQNKEPENTNSRAKRHGSGRRGGYRSGGGGGGRGRFMCSMECVFRNQSWLTTEGGVDVAALRNSLSNINNDTWQPILNEALNECSDQFSRANLTIVPGSQNCNPGPGLFAACLRRYMALKCPESLGKEDERCASQISSLKTCNPFAIATCNKGRSKGGYGGRRGGGMKPDKIRTKNRGRN